VEMRPGQLDFNRPGPQSSSAFQCASLAAAGEVDFAEMAAEQQRCSECADMQASSSLAVSVLKNSQYELLCDFSLGAPRPLVPKACRAAVFAAIHGAAHPGICATKRLLSSQFVWPRMASDVTRMCRDCVECQRSKVVRHVRAPVQLIELPLRRFAHLHVDIVGPFPVSAAGHRYLFTVIDRATLWVEAVPLADTAAAACAAALFTGWIARYGVPDLLTSDRGAHLRQRSGTQSVAAWGLYIALPPPIILRPTV
jgi:cleavage and polyadenylation specificity factor subunit 1